MELNEWVMLLVTIIVAIASLVFAATSEGAAGTIGMLISVVAVVYVFFQIKRYFDRVDAGRH